MLKTLSEMSPGQLRQVNRRRTLGNVPNNPV